MLATQHTNKLIHETSPYLLQHAENHVDWYPWGEEAFTKAKTEDKPIFLSIGYSTCHWCHVMAHESFEDEQIAGILNAGFVSIKVDREERPDIDEVYMHVCQVMTGSGGWPLTVFLTPDKKPFFAGTYFPKTSAFGRPGLNELLVNVIKAWQTSRKQLLENSERVMAFFKGETRNAGSADGNELIEQGYAHIRDSYEPRYGGFSQRPKFPTPHYLLFLLQYWKMSGNEYSLKMTQETLDHMARGGMYDHVGYGFSRYSTDDKWLVPHFEKMLYDNAMLLRAYTEGYAATGNSEYRDVAEQIIHYIHRDMTSSGGGFYAAEDADSEGEEGRFYVWTYHELKSALTADELKTLETQYGITERGNFEGKNIFNRISAKGACVLRGQKVLQKLFDIRKKRAEPFKDTKISAAWNGLMIEALARAGDVFDQDAYRLSAQRAADYMLKNMFVDGILQSTVKDGKHSGNAFLADYANMTNALIEMFFATRDALYLQKARSLAREMVQRFWDQDDVRFYMTDSEGEVLFMRPKDEYDGAMPSGNASAMMCLVRLAQLTGDVETALSADRAVQSFMAVAGKSPGAHVHYLSALMLRSRSHRQIVIAADRDDARAALVYRQIRQAYLPFATVIYHDKSEAIMKALPNLAQYKTDAPFAAYVCENFACKSPIEDPDVLIRRLDL